ncbi:serine protease [Brevundimonas sp.]|uniref:S1 family peptidase n=1 Tax=Brevundimonas sp. TaxID=1871086 RepID=UPI0028AD7FEB|nr:serine protease [Brevundimonas sp.]
MPETTITFSAVPIQTCEARAAGARQRRLEPKSGEGIEHFLVQDPFGIRRAILPMFAADDQGRMHGMGTAFAADPWGTFLTADHVVDFMRTGRPKGSGSSDQIYEFNGDQTLIAMLGIGMIFGTIGIPQEALARIIQTYTPGIQVEDPMDFIGGGVTRKPLDLAVLRSAERPPETMIANLPIRLRQPGPRIGDVVVAVGYPQIDTFHGDAERAKTRVAEGMFAGYGVVKELYPRGRDQANPTPVFEVGANWPSGMSGGPVFNMAGEVIGLVSRGLEPAEGETIGTAWATWFEALPQMSAWVPIVDPNMPDNRRGWGVIRLAPWSLAGFSPDETEADAILAQAGPGFEKLRGSWKIGTDEFISG